MRERGRNIITENYLTQEVKTLTKELRKRAIDYLERDYSDKMGIEAQEVIADLVNYDEKLREVYQELPLIFNEIFQELEMANDKHEIYFNSRHEAYAVIKEEEEEYWDEVKKDGHSIHLQEELIQLAAMAIKALVSERIANYSKNMGEYVKEKTEQRIKDKGVVL